MKNGTPRTVCSTTVRFCALHFKKNDQFRNIHHLGDNSLETLENTQDTIVLRSHHKKCLLTDYSETMQESNTSQILVCWC